MKLECVLFLWHVMGLLVISPWCRLLEPKWQLKIWGHRFPTLQIRLSLCMWYLMCVTCLNTFADGHVLQTDSGKKIKWLYLEDLNILQDTESLRLDNKLKMWGYIGLYLRGRIGIILHVIGSRNVFSSPYQTFSLSGQVQNWIWEAGNVSQGDGGSCPFLIWLCLA